MRLALRPSFAVLCSALLFGCGDSDSPKPAQTSSGSVEIFSWWVEAGEKDALDAMLATHATRRPDVRVINTVRAGNLNAVEELKKRLLENRPPDVFQTTSGSDLLQWVTRGTNTDDTSLLEPLDAVFDSEGWRDTFRDPVLERLTFNQHVYAVPVNMERNNTLFYNKKIFDANNLKPPESVDELLQTCTALKAKGITPLAIGTKQYWGIGAILWYDIMIASTGPDYFMDFFSGRKSADDPELRAALETLLKVLACGNTDTETIGWAGAADRVFEGQAAMTMIGDWVKGYYNSKGWKSDVDFGQIPSPGTRGTFVFATDTFCLPKGAPNRTEAIELVKTFGSAQAQAQFGIIKGSVPARIDSDESGFDSISQAALHDLQTNRVVPIIDALVPSDFLTAVQDSLNTFAKDGNIDNEIRVIRNRYEDLKSAR
jgi:glucose/mannose transport system substrate-binding protein